MPRLSTRCLAEVFGTFLLVFFGCGSVHTAVLLGAQAGLWQVAVVWGLGIAVAIYCVGGISGAHLNPAVTITLAVWRRCPARDVVPYIMSQLAGAMLGAVVLLVLFTPALETKEREGGFKKGDSASITTAMCYGEYYPNPGSLGAGAKLLDDAKVREFFTGYEEGRAMFAEAFGTMILAFVIFALTTPGNASGKFAPVLIGLTVSILISVLAPLTQAGFNPARDFGPRLVAYFAGWGDLAIPGPNGRGIVTVYIVAPIIGAVIGGGLFEILFRKSRETV